MVHSAEDGSIPVPDMSALIARLEAAVAGSRELGREVLAETNPYKSGAYSHWATAAAAFDWSVDVTTSLDAALALAERALQGCCPGVAKNVHHQDWYAWIGDKEEDGPLDLGNARSGAPALALCIAILRAIQHGYEAAGEVSPILKAKAQGEGG